MKEELKIIEENVNNKIDRELFKYVSHEEFELLSNAFYSNLNNIEFLQRGRKLSIDYINYNFDFRIKLVSALCSNYLFYNNIRNITIDEITVLTTYQISLCDFNASNSSLFLSNVGISSVVSIINLIRNRINDKLDNKEMKKKHGNSYDFFIHEMIHFLDSLYSVFILFSEKCYPQAMSVFRQGLENFITLKTISMNSNAIESFLDHQNITILDALGKLSKEELDKYIKENNLNYNNYKSYMNYGWLDEISEFRELKSLKPNTKYGIKAMANISKCDDYYEAMNFASNYVHSNFVFVSVDWNMIINQVLDGVYSMLDFVINAYSKLTGFDFIIDNFNYLETYLILKNEMMKNISLDPKYIL